MTASGLIVRHLDTTGDGTGTIDASVDGSSTPVVFKIVPPAGRQYHIYRFLLFLQDGNAGWASTTYGSIAALSNGVTMSMNQVSDDAVLQSFFETPVKSNAQWARYMYDVSNFDFGNGDKCLTARFTFQKFGRPLRLSEHEYLAVTVNDDLTGLVEQSFVVEGRDKPR